jgi:hypothetical protein
LEPARLAADIGGTFTDVVLEHAGRRHTAKVLTAAPGPRGDCYELEREAGGPHSAIMWKNQNLRGAPREAAYADAPPGYDPARSGVR